jgi:penicillin-binding protein 1A
LAVVAQPAPRTSRVPVLRPALRRDEGPGDPEFGAWLDEQIERRYGPSSRRDGPKPRTRWWWIKRGLVAGALAFVLLVGWLAITAPLSKSLPADRAAAAHAARADGTPIARNGAIVDAPVKVSELPEHVVQPFIAIEDRRSTATGASIRAAWRARSGAT